MLSSNCSLFQTGFQPIRSLFTQTTFGLHEF
jgi:hypothetical protein